MNTNTIDTTQFLLEAMQNLNSSLELDSMFVNMFAFLEKYFPIAGMSMHKYIDDKNVMRALYFVDKAGCKEINSDYAMSNEQVLFIKQLHENNKIVRIYAKDSSMYEFIQINMLSHMKRDNAHFLGTILKSNDEVIGQLIFFAKENKEFTIKDEEAFLLLQSIFTSSMINISHYANVMQSREVLLQENQDLRMVRKQNFDIVSKSQEMNKVIEMVDALAKKEVQILILGETGTGKEIVANSIQEKSNRHDKVFLKVNCGAIPESLIDSELFGYEKGAFTGAYSTKKGYFEQADGGTLFLDEIGELSLQAQVRLLRILQFGLIERVGGKQSIQVNVRIIAATNRNLENMLHMGTFREDLYYRLHSFPIKIPALRKRREDIPLLLGYFIKKYAQKNNIRTPKVDNNTLSTLINYSWPGNVRELENTVERCIVLASSNVVDFAEYLPKDPKWYMENIEHLDEYSFKKEENHTLLESFTNNKYFIQELAKEVSKYINVEKIQSPTVNKEVNKLKSVDDFLKEQIREALRESKGRICGKNSAAEILGLNCRTLRKRMEKLDLISRENW